MEAAQAAQKDPQIISVWLFSVSADGSLSGRKGYVGVGFYYV